MVEKLYKKVEKWNNETSEGPHTFNIGINFLSDLLQAESEIYYGLYRNQGIKTRNDLYENFNNFKKEYSKKYKSFDDEINRFQIWIKK